MVIFTEAKHNLDIGLAQSPTDTISFHWTYKGNNIILYYSGEFCGQDIFYLHITTPDDVVYIPFFMLPSVIFPGEIIVQAYIANEVYLALRGVAFTNSPAELLENVSEHIAQLDPITDFHNVGIADRERARGEATIHVANEEERIYLKTVRKIPMGKNMPGRIRAIYLEAEKIISFLKDNDMTLVFSDDPADARDVYLVLKPYGFA